MCLLSKLGLSKAFPQTSQGSKFLSPRWLLIFCCRLKSMSALLKTGICEWKPGRDFHPFAELNSLNTSLPECLKLSASFRTWECVECLRLSSKSPAFDDVSELVTGDFLSSASPPKLGGELDVEPGEGIITLDRSDVERSKGESEIRTKEIKKKRKKNKN